MFWIKRPKTGDSQTSWLLPYSDMMTLLLVIFIMIAAMSELRAGERFDVISGAVRQAFGFPGAQSGQSSVAVSPRLTLLQRLEQAGLKSATTVRLGEDPRLNSVEPSIRTADLEPAQAEVRLDGSRLIVHIAGPAAFEPSRAVLRPSASRAIEQIARLLMDAENALEVRAYADPETLPDDMLFHDGLDLSFARSRAVVDLMARVGIPRDRLCLRVMGHGGLPVADKLNANMPKRDRGIEVIVHAGSEASYDRGIAEKE